MSKTEDPSSGASGMTGQQASRFLGSNVREGYADIGDVQLHYVEAGDGPLVVLLHGFPEFWYGWRLQIQPLAAARFRVVAPDLRGYNLSSRPKGVNAYDADQLTADIHGLIQERGATSALLVGHDWGGTVAWDLAMSHPEVVDRLAEPDHDDVPNLDRVERLPDASHWVHHDEAERVPQLLIDFFGSALPASSR